MGLYNDLSVNNIVIISGVRPCGRTVDMQKNGRKNHGILYLWNGQATFSLVGGKKIIADAGQLIYLPMGCKYKMSYSAQSNTFVVVNFNICDGEGNSTALSDNISLLCNDDSANTIAGIMAKLETCATVQNLAGQFRRKELVYRLLSLTYSTASTVTVDVRYPQILKGVLLLKQTYLENLPIETFAKHSNVSISTFRQLFNKQYGMSPLQYRNVLRVERAKQLLEQGDCTVAEAAYASGFDNVGYFCRYFKKLTGITPKQSKIP